MRVNRHKLHRLTVQLNGHIKKPIREKDKEKSLLFILCIFILRLTVSYSIFPRGMYGRLGREEQYQKC